MDIKEYNRLTTALANTTAVMTQESSATVLYLFGDLGHPCGNLSWKEIAGDREEVPFTEWVSTVTEWSAHNGGWSFHLNLETSMYSGKERITGFGYESSGGRIRIRGDFDSSYEKSPLTRLFMIVQSRTCGDWTFQVWDYQNPKGDDGETQLIEAILDPIRGKELLARLPNGILRWTPFVRLITRSLELRQAEADLLEAERRLRQARESLKYSQDRLEEAKDSVNERALSLAEVYLQPKEEEDNFVTMEDDFVPPIDPELLRAFGAE